MTTSQLLSNAGPTQELKETAPSTVRPLAHRSYSRQQQKQQQQPSSDLNALPQDLHNLAAATNYATASNPNAEAQLSLPPWSLRPSMTPRIDSSRTTATVQPSSHEGSAACTPAASPLSDPMDRTIIARLEKGLEATRTYSYDEGQGDEPESSSALDTSSPDASLGGHGFSSAAIGWKHRHGSGTADLLAREAPSDEDRASGIASPDSWRSLLPEHDPFYASDAVLAAGAIRHRSSTSPTNSPSGSMSALRHSRDPQSESAISSRAASFSSQKGSYSSIPSLMSTLATPGPNTNQRKPRRASTRDSWRSLLPDDDPAALGGLSSTEDDEDEEPPTDLTQSRLSYQGLSSSKPLGSIDNRRPNSFSSFKGKVAPTDGVAKQQGNCISTQGSIPRATSAAMTFSSSVPPLSQTQRDRTRDNSSKISAAQESSLAASHKHLHDGHLLSSASTSSLPHLRTRESAVTTTPSSPRSAACSAMGDAVERENWPTSRHSRDYAFLRRARGEDDLPDEAEAQRWVDEQQLRRYSSGSRQTSWGNGSELSAAPVVESSEYVQLPSTGLGQPPIDVLNTTVTTSSSGMSPVGGEPAVVTTMTTTTMTTTIQRSVSSGAAHLPQQQQHLADKPLSASMTSASSVGQATRPPILSAPSLRFIRRPPPASAKPDVNFHTSPEGYRLYIRLPHFSMENITLSCKRSRALKIVASGQEYDYEEEVPFEADADMKGIRAEFDGTWLVVKVPRKGGSDKTASSEEETVAPFSSSSDGGSIV